MSVGLKQGDLDGACGFYAILNALDLITDGFSPEEKTFRRLIKCHPDAWSTEAYAPWSLIDGVARSDMTKTMTRFLSTERSLRKLGITVELPFWSRKPTMKEFWDTVRNHVRVRWGNDINTTAIVAFHDYRDRSLTTAPAHWTVVESMDIESMYLTESADGAVEHLDRSECTVIRCRKDEKGTVKRPYGIEAASTFLITRPIS